jgi:hypothetical protein
MFAMQVLPLGEGKTRVLMDYYVHPSKVTQHPLDNTSCDYIDTLNPDVLTITMLPLRLAASHVL